MHLKHTHTVCGVVLIIFCQYGWKMFHLNFDYFFEIGHHLNRLGAGQLENRTRMTPFCTWNIPTMFWDSVLIVSCHYSWKMFYSNFDDFFGSGHHRNRPWLGKFENRARMNLFCTRNIPTMFGVQFLSFPTSTAKKYFGQILMTFQGPESTRARKAENQAQMTSFFVRNIPTLFGVQFFKNHRQVK